MNRRQLGPLIRATELASWIMMASAQRGRSTLIVEGSSDSNLFFLPVDTGACRLIVAEGRPNVLGAIEIVRKTVYSGVLAIIDSDFDRLEGTLITADDVACTDTHDLETLMLRSSAYKKILLRYGFGVNQNVELRVEEFHRAADQLLDRLLDFGKRLGYLRWASSKYQLGIRFSELNVSSFLDASTLVIREDRLEDAILRVSDASAGDWNDIVAKANALKAPGHDCWQLCNGHDLTAALALHLSRTTQRQVTSKSIQADLTLAYDVADFVRTEMYAKILAWERRNTPRRILRRSYPHGA